MKMTIIIDHTTLKLSLKYKKLKITICIQMKVLYSPSNDTNNYIKILAYC